MPCPVDGNGRFTPEVPDFAGRHVKEADGDICLAIKGEGLRDGVCLLVCWLRSCLSFFHGPSPPVSVMSMPISTLPTHTLTPQPNTCLPPPPPPIPGKGRLVVKATYQHSYPFCWRSDTPLIYKAVPSWFIAVQVRYTCFVLFCVFLPHAIPQIQTSPLAPKK